MHDTHQGGLDDLFIHELIQLRVVCGGALLHSILISSSRRRIAARVSFFWTSSSAFCYKSFSSDCNSQVVGWAAFPFFIFHLSHPQTQHTIRIWFSYLVVILSDPTHGGHLFSHSIPQTWAIRMMRHQQNMLISPVAAYVSSRICQIEYGNRYSKF